MKENKIEIATDIDYGTISLRKRGKSIIKIGNERLGGTDVEVVENSIEEDIKNIEEIIELSKEEIDAKDENITAILDIEDLISLEHILSDYKRVLKENEELLEVKVSASAHNRILELEKDNKELEKRLDEINKTNFPIIN